MDQPRHGASRVKQFRAGGDVPEVHADVADRGNVSDAPSLLTRALGPLDFEHNPGFLVGRLSRRMTAEMDRRMREHGLTFAQAAVISRLWWQDGLSQSELQ